MDKNGTKVRAWSRPEVANAHSIASQLDNEGLNYYQWSNRPGDVYSAHSHVFDKILYVVEGSISFILPEENQVFELKEGDRLELPAGIKHSAVVGPKGVVCFESHLRRTD